mmetsp:Transcript_22865/g.58282  ORF Transcript_22865/g.58282 Transcript_22865/m.58282 type:complete len:214 (+) Transcript_22865:506-1147(+)
MTPWTARCPTWTLTASWAWPISLCRASTTCPCARCPGCAASSGAPPLTRTTSTSAPSAARSWSTGWSACGRSTHRALSPTCPTCARPTTCGSAATGSWDTPRTRTAWTAPRCSLQPSCTPSPGRTPSPTCRSWASTRPTRCSRLRRAAATRSTCCCTARARWSAWTATPRSRRCSSSRRWPSSSWALRTRGRCSVRGGTPTLSGCTSTSWRPS